MNDFLNFNEMRTEHKIQEATYKKVEFQQDEYLEASEFHIMGWQHFK